MSVAFDTALKFPAKWLTGGLIDPVTGIISGVWEQPRHAGYADLFQYAAMSCDTGAFGGPDNFRHVGGASLDRRSAWVKAVGEGVERYCSAIYDPNAFPLVARKAASFDTVDPALFALYPDDLTAQHDFPFGRFDAATPVRWAAAETLAGRALHVPAAAVYVPWYYDMNAGESPIFQPISTGLSCHVSEDRARLGGLMEVVERDAFTLLWQTRGALVEIAQTGLPTDSAEILRRIHATGARVRIGLVPTDHGIPVCVATQSIDSGDMPAFSLAASASPDPAEAVRKALEELVHTFRWMARLQASSSGFEPGDGFINVSDQETHLLFWCDPRRRAMADFLWRTGEAVEFAAIPGFARNAPRRTLEEAVSRVEATGHTPYFVDLTTPDAAHFGFHVTRAIVPGFNPLFMGHAIRSRTNPRLRDRLMTLHSDAARAATNDLPHPFP